MSYATKIIMSNDADKLEERINVFLDSLDDMECEYVDIRISMATDEGGGYLVALIIYKDIDFNKEAEQEKRR